MNFKAQCPTDGTMKMAKNVLRFGGFVAIAATFSLSFAADMPHGGVQLWEDGPYWAECNLGANRPEESGYYYKWGDTTGYKPEGGSWTEENPDQGYSGVTWVSSDGRRMNESPFATSKGRGDRVLDASGNLAEEYDAATVNLGKPWRIPTDADFEGLVRNCRTSWTTRGGVPGLLVSGNGTYASKSIFLPAAGRGDGDWIHFYRPGKDGYYWASTTYPRSSTLACDMAVWSYGASCGGRLRGYGQCIRPVWGRVSKVIWTIRNGELTDVDLNGETDVIIPNSVKIIGAYAFRRCHYDLKSVIIPDSVTLIGAQAFADCCELRSVMLLKNSLPSCESDAFKQVSEDCVVYVDRAVGDLQDGDRWNDLIVVKAPLPFDTAKLSQPTFTIQHGELGHVALNGATQVVIPSSVTEIRVDAFDNCPELESVLIPVSVTWLNPGTFRMCNNLTNITMLASVARVDDSLFLGCDQLTSVTIGGGVKEIGRDSFAGCSSLKCVMISSSVTSIDDGAFGGCHNMSVVVSPKVKSVKPNGATVKVVVGNSDITDYLAIPESDGTMNIAAATVKEEIVKEALDPSKDAVINLNAANPQLVTAPTRKGLTYTLFEGHKLESLSKGDSKLGDGDPWKPRISVSGGDAAFYSIGVSK